jgi:methenyltetrahydromethanopterin cyclohydrolase
LKKVPSVNRLAWKLLEKLTGDPVSYGVSVEKTRSQTIIIDAGISEKGGFQAGRLITEICMGGCARARISHRKYGDLELPSIFVCTDHPVIATLGSQYAGWQIDEDGYFAIGSGPGRALALKPKEIYQEIKYKDDFDKAIVVLETGENPPAKLIERLAKDCQVSLKDLAIILTPTTSIAGATQVSGRIIETGIHKLRRLGFDTARILHAWGCAPIPPVHPKFVQAMARTNDAILYGGVAYYVVKHGDEKALRRILAKAPSTASKSYGKSFMEIFKGAGYDFYKVDPNLFAPAVVVINDARTGRTLRAGEVNPEMLAKSFGF